ncbi:MAG: right-handed parallel beta-helix repeat-containing protein, partial [Betaproteobacteria bacterium]|nr:right-handed parallel beta-helix repeat-containing protein [Betaproteobacteria bacterium]
SVLRNVKVTNANTGILVDNSALIANHIALADVIASNNGVYGVAFQFSSNNTLSGITASNNGSIGISFFSGLGNNSLSNVTVSSNQSMGIDLRNSDNNTVIGVTANNNGFDGILLVQGTENNLVAGVTANNNGNGGIELFSGANNNLLTDVAVGHNGVGEIVSTDSSNNRFTGRLHVVNASPANCVVSGGTNPGLIGGTCANDVAAGSDATLITTGISPATSFVGKLTSDDSVNLFDANGASAYPLDPATFDWTHFANRYRSWGIDGSAFPNANHRGQWVSPTSGRIWDWSLSAGDTVLRNVLALPTGNDVLTHTWSDASTTTFLRHAVEISGDRIGNDNLLCESGEACLYTPNIGGYQGHGSLVSAGPFTDGTVTGVTLMRRASNGR